MNLFADRIKKLDASLVAQYGPALCESELRAMENDLVVETFVQFSERMGLNSAKQAVAASLDQMREIAA